MLYFQDVMKKTCIFLLYFLLISFYFISAGNINDYNKYEDLLIKDIYIKGQSKVSIDITAQLLSKKDNPLKMALLESDKRRVYSLGFFSDVTAKVSPIASDQVEITFFLVENPMIKEIYIEGNSVYKTDYIFSKLKSKKNTILNLDLLRQDVSTIEKNLYDEKGYILAKITNIENPNASNDYTLSFYISEGIVDEIQLEGNEETKDYVILREMLLKEGSVFNRDVLISDLRRVFNLNFFSNINPQYYPSSKDPNKILLVITLEEKSANSVNFGGGWGASQGGFAFINFQMGNLFGTGQLVSAKAQLGGTSTYQLKYYNPWMWSDKTSFTARYWLTEGRSLGIEGIEDSSTEENRYGFDLSIGKKIMKNITGKLTLLNEDVAPSGNERYNIRSIAFSLAYDTRDIWMDPRSGVYYVIGLEEAGRFLNGTVSYTKWWLNLNTFIKIAEEQTLASRVSWARFFGEVKATEEYWVGGPNTVRGFQSGSYFSRGREKVILNVEYRYRFNEMIQGVVFYDIGNAWETITDFVGSQKYRSGYGVGARVQTPLGPVRLDYGIPDDKEFGRGVIHFSIGHVF